MTEMNVETIREALKTVVINFVERAWNIVKEILRRVGDNLRKMARATLVVNAPQPFYTARYERDTSWHNRLIASGKKRQTHRMMEERYKRGRRSS